MTTVVLIRHGENEYVKKGRLAGRLPGVHLNDTGRAQAQKLAAHLKEMKLKAIYASPLERAVETAAPLAAMQGLKVILRDGLLELDMGDWEDRTLKSVRRLKQWKTVQQHPSRMRFPNGESFAECQLRWVNEIETLVAKHRPKDVIACVGHSDPIKLALAYFGSIPLDSFQRYVIQPASMSTLHFSEGGVAVVNMNVTIRG
jgi:probable phosphoglycerate mutase